MLTHKINNLRLKVRAYISVGDYTKAKMIRSIIRQINCGKLTTLNQVKNEEKRIGIDK